MHHNPLPLFFFFTVLRRPLPPFISLPIHHRLQNLTIQSQVPEKELISKENKNLRKSDGGVEKCSVSSEEVSNESCDFVFVSFDNH